MVKPKRDGEIVPRTESAMPFGLSNDFDSMFEDMDSWFWGPSFALTPRMATHGMRVPRINVKDEPEAFLVSAEMPGVKKENLQLNINVNVLEISARESQETKEEDEKTGYIYREMSQSSFQRQIRFGQDIVPEECDAELKDGILTVRLKKAHIEKPKKHSIAVK